MYSGSVIIIILIIIIIIIILPQFILLPLPGVFKKDDRWMEQRWSAFPSSSCLLCLRGVVKGAF